MNEDSNILRDIAENDANNRLDLRKFQSSETKKETSTTESSTQKATVLRPLQNTLKSNPSKSRKNHQEMQDIRTFKPKDPDFETHFEYEEKSTNPRIYNLREALKIAASGFIVLFVINIINIFYVGINTKDEVTTTAMNGFTDLLDASTATTEFNLEEAVKYIKSAQNDFSKAEKEITFINQSIEADKNPISAGHSIVSAGDDIAQAGEKFIQALDGSESIYSQFIRAHSTLDFSANQGKPSLTDQIVHRYEFIKQAHQHLSSAEEKLASINPEIIPAGYRDNFQEALDKIKNLNQTLAKVDSYLPQVLKLLGHDHPHRFLILLQNNSETRPTGGFIGSFIILDTNDGYITKFDFKDVYDADGQLHEPIEAPEEIAKLTDTWRLRDSNYSPDFRISAAKAAWFLEKEKGPGVDTVIAINKTLLEELLAITGPVELEGISQPITAENYHIILTYLVESKWAGEGNPKDVIKNLIPEVQKKLLTKENLPKLITLLLKEFQQKKILFYSKDSELQQAFEEKGIAGAIIKPDPVQDYLSVIAISIGGNKSDRYIKQQLFHHTYLEADGSIINELTISREHTFDPGVEQHIKSVLRSFGFDSVSSGLLSVIGKGENKVAIKAYIPKGAELLEVSGMEKTDISTRYNEDLDKTYFYFFMNTSPQEISRVTLRYKIPLKLNWWPADTYRLIVQKQPGFISPVDFEKKIIPNAPLRRHSLYPESWEDENGIVTYKTNLLYDRLFAGVWGN